MNPQLHINVSAPTARRMQPISQGVWQPTGGLWTFSDEPETEAYAFWMDLFSNMRHIQYLNPRWHRMIGKKLSAWQLHPSPKARIATIDSPQDYLDLGNYYGWFEGHWDSAQPTSPVEVFDPGLSPNYLAMSQDFDALQITDQGTEMLDSPEMGRFRVRFWHAESTVWFRWCFSKTKALGSFDKIKPTDPADVTTLLRRFMWAYEDGSTPPKYFLEEHPLELGAQSAAQ